MIGAPWTEHATLVPAAIVCMRDSERCVRIEEAARADMVRVEWRPIVRISSVSRILSSTMEEASVRTHALERLAAWDRGLCRRFNSASQFTGLRVLMIAVSRLGNGAFWYGLMAAMLAWNGQEAIPAVLHMTAVGLVCTVVYKSLKHGTARARPYVSQTDITLSAAPLDQYSFPSGHTLHATAFTLVAVTYYPALFWLLAPFSLSVAFSRVVLGLHYPSDVIAGAVIGAAIAVASTVLF
jgi:undecaprenyl-diphosphatase